MKIGLSVNTCRYSSFGVFVNVLKKINQVFSSVSGQQKKIAIFITEHHKQAAFMTSAELAKASDVSPATVNRFCQQLGYRGYSDFQTSIQALLQNELTALDRVESRHDNQYSLQKVWTDEINALHLSLSRLALESYGRAVEKLSTARNLFIVGHQACEPVALYAAYCLSKIKPGVQRLDLRQLDCLGALNRMGPEDAALVFNMPRYPIKTVQALHALKVAGVGIVMVSHTDLCDNAQLADVMLVAPVRYHQFADGLSPLICLVNALALDLYKRNEKEGKRALERFEQNSDLFFVSPDKPCKPPRVF